MPICFQYIDFVIGIFGLFISLFTLYATFNVRKRIIHNAEYSDFYNSIDEITDKLQADINSINDDRLRNPKFVTLLSQELTDIETRFTFLSPKAKRPILKIRKVLRKSEFNDIDWSGIANNLIILKNKLMKEKIYHG